MTSAHASTYAVLPADLAGDRDLLREIVNRNTSSALAEVSQARLDWLFDQNPAGATLGWFLRTEPDGRTVGTGSLVPRVMRVDGASVVCARASLLAVDSTHRALGPAAMIARRGVVGAQEHGFPTVLGVAPPATIPIFTRCGYVRLGDYVRYAKPLSLAPQFTRLTGVTRGAGAASALPDLLLRLGSRDSWLSAGDGVVRTLTEFDSRFDDLWSRAGASYGFTTARTSAFLRWRFTACPDPRAFVVHGWLSPDLAELRGYAVSSTDGPHAFLYDLFADADGDAMDRVLAAAIRWARSQRAQTLSIWIGASPRVVETLTRFGFRPRSDGPKTTAVLVAGYDAGVVKRISESGWYILAADNV